MRFARWPLGLAMILTMLFAVCAVAQEESEETDAAPEAASTSYQETVEFGPLKSTDLDGKAGQIEVNVLIEGQNFGLDCLRYGDYVVGFLQRPV